MENKIRRKKSARPDEGRLPRLNTDGFWLSLAGVGLIYAGHVFYGAMAPNTSLTLCIGAAVILLVCAIHPGLRQDMAKIRGLQLPALFFGLTIVVALWSLTPYVPGGPAPVWDYIGVHPGSASINKSATIIEIIRLLGLACLFMVGAVTGASDARARTAVNLFVIVGGLFGLWAILIHVTGATVHEGPRLEAHFLAPNTAGGFFAGLALLSAGPLAGTLRGGSRQDFIIRLAPFASATLVALVCLLMTGSRGGTVAAVAGFVAYGLLQVFAGRLKLTRAVILGIGGILLGLIVIAVAGDLLLARAMEGGENADARTQMGVVHWHAFQASPWMGYGLGSFEALNRSLMDAGNLRYLWSVRATHNLYLQWLEEAGALGAAPMFLCIAVILATTLRQTLRRSRMTDLLFAILAMDTVYLVHSISDFDLQTYSVAAGWAYLLGLQYCLSQGSRS